MTPEETPKPLTPELDLTAIGAEQLAAIAPTAELLAALVVEMVDCNAKTLSKAMALAHKRHAGLAVHFHPDGHVECLVTHTVPTGTVEHYIVTDARDGATKIRVDIEDETHDSQG